MASTASQICRWVAAPVSGGWRTNWSNTALQASLDACTPGNTFFLRIAQPGQLRNSLKHIESGCFHRLKAIAIRGQQVHAELARRRTGQEGLHVLVQRFGEVAMVLADDLEELAIQIFLLGVHDGHGRVELRLDDVRS